MRRREKEKKGRTPLDYFRPFFFEILFLGFGESEVSNSKLSGGNAYAS